MRIFGQFKGQQLRARILRALSSSLVGFGGTNVLRLLGNLALTRLLFPEAFGLMALVSVFTTGLRMFSDLGIRSAVIRSPRGDEEDFLNTAWILKILQGTFLALCTCAAAYPMSWIYGEPILIDLLLIVALNPFIAGFMTTRGITHARHLKLVMPMILSLCCLAGGLLITIYLAWQLQSVYALAIGSLANTILRVIAFRLFLPGIKNRPKFERAAIGEIFGFGKFVFLSTMSSFLINQGDKAIFGIYVSLTLLGIYNIGHVLGALPLLLMRRLIHSVIFPLYRLRPPDKDPSNQRSLFKARRLLVTGALGGNALMALISVDLIGIMFDDRYALAGPMILMIGLASIPNIVFAGYTNALMAYGNTRRMFHVQLATALSQIAYLFAGLIFLGFIGGLLAPALGAITTYPLLRRFVMPYKALDEKADMGFLAAGFSLHALICWYHWSALTALAEAGV
ncbi:MAG: oligosaccharide flippase family protein [Paracoccaceae bacterium]